MLSKSKKELYHDLRAKYPFCTYESFNYQLKDDAMHIEFSFNINNSFYFKPTLTVFKNELIPNFNIDKEKLDNLVFHIGMVELISYWKSCCSPIIIVKPYQLNEDQIIWWKKLYYKGLGEFFYINNIDVEENFIQFKCDSQTKLNSFDIELSDSFIVPIGGGKDSAVTLEMIKQIDKNFACLILNPRGATIETVKAADIPNNQFLHIHRTIDKELLNLNEKGFLNGHTPFSAMLAFVTLLTSAISGRKNIALSNESSANESTVENSHVNHQYSKSFEFEKDFREYVEKYISKDFNYFSFLRPLNELQIAKFFSGYTQYHNVFKSCNAGSKTDVWCCNCPKCLFAYIILSPFISPTKMIEIFGENLFEKSSMLPFLSELTGQSAVKPFECVGTIEEVNIALCITIQKFYNEGFLPLVLKNYKNSLEYSKYSIVNKDLLLKNFNNQHFLNKNLVNLLQNQL